MPFATRSEKVNVFNVEASARWQEHATVSSEEQRIDFHRYLRLRTPGRVDK